MGGPVEVVRSEERRPEAAPWVLYLEVVVPTDFGISNLLVPAHSSEFAEGKYDPVSFALARVILSEMPVT